MGRRVRRIERQECLGEKLRARLPSNLLYDVFHEALNGGLGDPMANYRVESPADSPEGGRVHPFEFDERFVVRDRPGRELSPHERKPLRLSCPLPLKRDTRHSLQPWLGRLFHGWSDLRQNIGSDVKRADVNPKVRQHAARAFCGGGGRVLDQLKGVAKCRLDWTYGASNVSPVAQTLCVFRHDSHCEARVVLDCVAAAPSATGLRTHRTAHGCGERTPVRVSAPGIVRLIDVCVLALVPTRLL